MERLWCRFVLAYITIANCVWHVSFQVFAILLTCGMSWPHRIRRNSTMKYTGRRISWTLAIWKKSNRWQIVKMLSHRRRNPRQELKETLVRYYWSWKAFDISLIYLCAAALKSIWFGATGLPSCRFPLLLSSPSNILLLITNHCIFAFLNKSQTSLWNQLVFQ